MNQKKSMSKISLSASIFVVRGLLRVADNVTDFLVATLNKLKAKADS